MSVRVMKDEVCCYVNVIYHKYTWWSLSWKTQLFHDKYNTSFLWWPCQFHPTTHTRCYWNRIHTVPGYPVGNSNFYWRDIPQNYFIILHLNSYPGTVSTNCWYCLLWIKKVRVTDKTYTWVSVWWKTKNEIWEIYTSHILWCGSSEPEDFCLFLTLQSPLQ